MASRNGETKVRTAGGKVKRRLDYEVFEAQTFWDCVLSLQRDDARNRAALMESMIELRRQPFHNPVLQTHDLGAGLNGRKVFSSDVGGRRSDRRLIWQLFDKTVVLLLYGTHAMQDRAKRMRVSYDESDKRVTVYELAPDSGAERPYPQQRAEMGRLFRAWTDAELAGFGFDGNDIERLRRFNSDDELLAAEAALGPASFERAFNLHAYGNPDGPVEVVDEGVEAVEPEVTDEDRELAELIEDERAGAWFTQCEPEFLAEVLGQPIEDWMIFLHPDQRAMITRNFEGPARVRGAAGTGKTVVGLHRAAWLAERNRSDGETRSVLFTTFIKSLPPVFEALYLRLPGTRAGEVEFVHIDRLAWQVCAADGDRPAMSQRDVDAAFATAVKRTVYPGTPLADAGFSRQYLRDEITAVIKGRAIASLDTYLEIAHTGRRAPLGRQQRTQVWELMTAWDAEMAQRGTLDFADVVLRARDHARRLTAPRYSAAVVDEAQDLSLAGLQLVRALVNGPAGGDRRNGLLLLGDGAQRIYAGGFKLRQAGVEVRGRTTVLRVNYRNTGEIIGAAMSVAGDVEVDDLGEEFRRGDEPVDLGRHGAKPLLIQTVDFDGQIDEIARRIAALDKDQNMSAGDVGVLVPTNHLAKQVVSRLEAARVGVQELDKYDGRPNERVKVGTYHRGKGLEFKVVFLPGLSKGVFPRPPAGAESGEEAAEARDLAIAQLFVAMTRARDELVVLFDGEPADVIGRRLDRFEQLVALPDQAGRR